ncbi:cation:proton antiporter domain-containing protein [Streptomyces lanatus]|uniref:Cation:proton antiporter n=1 Tax=Streptomyces lanatus TaxID=66900 RepID=A0ABV1Y5V4_9ACTN|nr:cation:proton antiporter [Streptomyces lanatus]
MGPPPRPTARPPRRRTTHAEILGLTLIVAALAELIHASAPVGAFLVGLTLTGETADRARAVLSPLRDLFAAVFFLAIGLTVSPDDLLPLLPAALALAAITTATKLVTGHYAVSRDQVGRRGRGWLRNIHEWCRWSDQCPEGRHRLRF